MKLGILIECEQGLTWERWRRIVATVERLGFESLWLSDHFLSPDDPARDSLETWTALTVAAAETSRLRLGPLVCPLTYRHPALLARMAAAVDQLSGGRLVLGLGAGWNAVEHRAFGLEFPPLGQRMDRLEEGIEVIRRLLDDGPASFEGRYYRLQGADPRPKPLQRPRLPLLLGGGGERRTLPLVARYADEWDVPGGLSPAAFRAKSARLDELCRASGREPSSILRSASTAYLVARDEGQLRQRAEAIQQLDPKLAGLDWDEVVGVLRSWNWRVGTPRQLAEEFAALAEAGAERVVLQHNDQENFEALEVIAKEVMPAIGGD